MFLKQLPGLLALRDLTGKVWQLDSLGTIDPGQEKQIKRGGQPVALNNGSDTENAVGIVEFLQIDLR